MNARHLQFADRQLRVHFAALRPAGSVSIRNEVMHELQLSGSARPLQFFFSRKCDQ